LDIQPSPRRVRLARVLLPVPVNLSQECRQADAPPPGADFARGKFLVPASGIVYSPGKPQTRQSTNSSFSDGKCNAISACSQSALRPIGEREASEPAKGRGSQHSRFRQFHAQRIAQFGSSRECSRPLLTAGPQTGRSLSNAPVQNMDNPLAARTGPVAPEPPGIPQRANAFRLRRALLRIE
jgi:hypothetical protein